MPYDAFISYSHGADLELAPAVRDGLQKLAKPWIGRRALNVFLDQASLELSSELGGSLDARIEDTRWLVLFMSEQSAQSRWVGAELAEWAAKKSKQQIALVLTSGEVVWDEQARDFDYQRSTAVSEGMRGVYTGQASEPLFLDLRWTKEIADGEKSLDLDHPRFRDAIATLAAPIHGIPKDELEGEDLRQFRLGQRVRRAAIIVLAILTIAAAVAAYVAWEQKNIAIRERDESEARRLATVATVNAAEQTDVALLLALESLSTTATDEGWSALFTALSRPVLARSPQAGHDRGVNRVLFNPDGLLLASMGGDGTLALWNPRSGRNLVRARGDDNDTNLGEAAFSPDGSLLATPSNEGSVRVWKVDRNAGLQPLEVFAGAREAAVWDVSFSPDGRLLASAGADGTVRLWDLERQQQRLVESMGTGVQVWEVAFSSDGGRVLWVSSDGSVRSRALAPGAPVELLLAGHPEWATGSTAPGVAFSSDRSRLAIASGDWTLQLWDLSSATPVMRTLRGHDGFVVDLAFSADGTLLASASLDRSVRLWDGTSGAPVGEPLTGHDAEVFGVDFSPDGTLLVSGGGDRRLRRWDLDAGGRPGRRLDHGAWAVDVVLSPDGKRAASTGLDSRIVVWDVTGGERPPIVIDTQPDQGVSGLAWSPDERLLASAGDDGVVRLWNADSGEAHGEPLRGHRGRVCAVAFDPRGEMLASTSGDRTIRLWDYAKGEQRGPALLGHKSTACVLAFDKDGTRLASADLVGGVWLWDVDLPEATGVEIAGDGAALRAMRFEADGLHLLAAGKDGRVRRWNLAKRTAEEVLDQRTDWTAASFSDDAATLTTASADGSLRRWDLATGSQAGVTWAGPPLRVESLALSRDGSLLVSASEDGGVRLWPAQTRWRALACEAAGRNLSRAEWQAFVATDRPYRRQCPGYPPYETAGPAPARSTSASP